MYSSDNKQTGNNKSSLPCISISRFNFQRVWSNFVSDKVRWIDHSQFYLSFLFEIGFVTVKRTSAIGLREASREPKESLENRYLLGLEYWTLQQSKFSSMAFLNSQLLLKYYIRVDHQTVLSLSKHPEEIKIVVPLLE